MKDIQYILFGFFMMLLINSIIYFIIQYFECNEVTLTNIFRTNLFCIGLTKMEYHIQEYQLNFYIALSFFIYKKLNGYFVHYKDKYE
jgi:hypothetical protein